MSARHTPGPDESPAGTAAGVPGGTPARPTVVRPYGDMTGDGMVQVSFTLPVPHDKRAEGAALWFYCLFCSLWSLGKEPRGIRGCDSMCGLWPVWRR